MSALSCSNLSLGEPIPNWNSCAVSIGVPLWSRLGHVCVHRPTACQVNMEEVEN